MFDLPWTKNTSELTFIYASINWSVGAQDNQHDKGSAPAQKNNSKFSQSIVGLPAEEEKEFKPKFQLGENVDCQDEMKHWINAEIVRVPFCLKPLGVQR
jgi:hypothetical protein